MTMLVNYLSSLVTENFRDLSKQGKASLIFLKMLLELKDRKKSLCSMVSKVIKTNVLVCLSLSSNFSMILWTISSFFLWIFYLTSDSSFILTYLYS